MNPTISLITSRYSEHSCVDIPPRMRTDHSKPLHSYYTYYVMSLTSDNNFHNMTNEATDNTFRASHSNIFAILL